MSPARARMLGSVLIALATWCLPRSSSAAITVDTPNISSATANAASLTWSHTVGAGADRILIVGTSHRGNQAITGVTYGGTPLTPIGSVTNGILTTSALWSLLAPPQGTAPVVVTIAGSVRIVGGAVSFFGVDQVNPRGTYASATGSTLTASVTATNAAGELVIDTVAVNGTAVMTVGAGQTARWNTATAVGTDVRGGGSTETGAASLVMSWALGAVRVWAIGAVPLRPVPLSGTVFEDVNYGGGAGRDLATASGVPRSGARVELYDGAGSFVSFTTTDASGEYSFSGIAAGNYTVRVVNSTVTSSRTAVAGLLPVQTYRTDASTGTAVPVTDHVGGQDPAVADAGSGSAGTTMNTATGVFTAGISGTAQSITNVAIGTPGVSGVNFGFNFNAIVNVNDAGQGSLRQYILNSNALDNTGLAIVGQPAGRDVSIFMISDGLAHPGLRAGLANLLTAGVAVIVVNPAADLPAITAANTSVDGTTQTTNVGNTNAGVLGTGGTAGVDGLALGTVAGPEVEIRGDSGTNNNGLLIQGAIAANAIVRGLAIHGFGDANGEAGVNVNGGSTALIERNVLGSSATSFADPGSSAQRSQGGVYGASSSNSTVQNNLIGFGRTTGIYLAAGATGWTLAGNEIRDSGRWDNADGDGITINAGTTNTATGNLVTGASSQGIVVTAGGTGNVFTNNTVTGNGVGTPTSLVQSTGIVLRSSAASTVLDRNVVRANYGAGVQVNNGSTGTRMTRNSLALNGTITARNGAVATGQIGIDLNSATDSIDLGTSPFPTLNDAADADTGGNGLLNFPVLWWATLSGGILRVGGYARPGSVIELFIASLPPDPTGFGEGTTYSITLTEGGTGTGGNDPYPDTDAGTGTYGPAAVNGIAQGTDTTNRFAFALPVPAGIGVGTLLTATATLGGETSEFGGNVTVALGTAVELMSFEAAPSDEAVELSWRTGSELSNLGFHLHRSSSVDGPWTRITASLIPGLGSSPVGASYSYVDAGLVPGQRYYYKLEDVDASSVSTLHGPVWAVPAPSPPAEDGGGDGGGDGAERGNDSVGDSSKEGPGEGCPTWVLAAHGDSSSPVRCTPHGDPDSVSLQILARTSRSVDLELRTGGFWSVIPRDSGVTGPEGSTGIRAYARGFDTPADPQALALPLRRALVDAVVGKRVRLASVEAFDEQRFRGLRPSAVGALDLVASRDGTVLPLRRSVGAARLSAGISPAELARLVRTVFQGERKRAVLELTPLRYDGGSGDLVLTTRVRVRLLFAGVEPGETGTGSTGRRARVEASHDVLAQLYTARRGLHGVRFEEVFPGRVRGVGTTLLRLQRQGEAVRFRVEPRPEVFGPGSVLYFHVEREARSTDFTGEVAYELVRSGDGELMGTILGAPEGPPVTTAPLGLVTQEVNRIYQSGLLEAEDVWQWEALPSPSTRTKSVTLEGVDEAGSGRVVVFLQGASESGTVVDHHVRVVVNGTQVGETSFAGKTPYRLEASVPASVLKEGLNEVLVENVGDTGVTSLFFLDRFEVLPPRKPQASEGSLEGQWNESGTVEVSGLSSPAVVLDVTGGNGEPAPTWLVGVVRTRRGGARFRAEAGHRYVVVSNEGLLRPRVVRPEASTLRSVENEADYLLIGPGSFLAAAEPLLEKRASEGLVTKAVSLEEIAQEFGHGEASGEAIRSFVSDAYHSWTKPSPRYVVLLGDATYDPRRFAASTTQESPMPALWGKTSYLWTALDPVMGAVNGEDDVPDVAVGRIPATTVEEAERLVGKLLAWEASGQGIEGKALLVADNPDAAGDFEGDVEDIRTSYLGGRETEVLKVGQLGASTRPAIQAALDGGLSLVSYVGHGGSAVWASENVWNSWDAPSLRAQSRQPLLLTMNCLNGYFVGTNFESLSESLVKAEGRGAIAAFSPSGLSVDGPAHQYHRALVGELVSGHHERLGDAILAAQGVYAETGLLPELLSIYHLFGDPATPIR